MIVLAYRVNSRTVIVSPFTLQFAKGEKMTTRFWTWEAQHVRRIKLDYDIHNFESRTNIRDYKRCNNFIELKPVSNTEILEKAVNNSNIHIEIISTRLESEFFEIGSISVSATK